MTVSRFKSIFVIACIISTIPVSSVYTNPNSYPDHYGYAVYADYYEIAEESSRGAQHTLAIVGLAAFGAHLLGYISPLQHYILNKSMHQTTMTAVGLYTLTIRALNYLTHKRGAPRRHFFNSIEHGNLEQVKNELKKNISKSDLEMALRNASRDGKCSVVKELLRHGVNPDSSIVRGFTALNLACHFNHQFVAYHLLQSGATLPDSEQLRRDYNERSKQCLRGAINRHAASLKLSLDDEETLPVDFPEDLKNVIIKMVAGETNTQKVKEQAEQMKHARKEAREQLRNGLQGMELE